ncbi:MAG TPA: GAF domain-containing SpoIIE family protein phosphatase [Solirubrobacteraceae bacterium]|nr:GAF domain-containing SpoIIE family protein phosphatase [Solirubrobacteraceae bacterium]
MTLRRRDWASRFGRDEAHAAVMIAAGLYLVGAALTATAALAPHVGSPAAVIGVAIAACITAAALIVAARSGHVGFGLACAADLWGIVLILVLCAATGGAQSPFALIYFFAVCHAAAFQPTRRFLLVMFVALAAFLAPVAYEDVPLDFAPFAGVGVVLLLFASFALHVTLAWSRRQRRRLQFMIAASKKLDSSLDPSQTLRKIARSAVPELAELCVIDVVDHAGRIETVAVSLDPSVARRLEQLRHDYPLDLHGPHPVARALATGEPQIVEADEATLDDTAQSDEHMRFMRDVGYRSAAVFPMSARHRTHGTVSFLHVGVDAVHSGAELGVLEDLTARAALAYDNARLYAERAHIANVLQRSLMPPKLPRLPWLDLASYFRPIGPANRIGGDFYDAFGDDRKCWLLLGDVCGKGPEAAALTGLLRQSTRAYARETASPSAVLASVNATMIEQELSDGFATAVLVHLEPRGDHVDARFAAAGHPPALVVRQNGDVDEFGEGGLLGLAGARSEDFATRLAAGDALALYTDGLPDARAPQQILGVAEMTAELRRGVPASAQGVVDALLKPVAPDGDVRDDIAVLAALARNANGAAKGA